MVSTEGEPTLADRLRGVHNTRDLAGIPTSGGGRVQSGRLFRSASLSGAYGRDIEVLLDAGIRDVIDLRADWERAATGTVPDDFVVHEVALVTDDQRASTHDILRDHGLVGYYSWIAEQATAQVVEVVALVAGTADGILVQCGAGKDRTGLVVAVLLDLVGAERAAVVADYARTTASLRAIGAALADTPGYDRSIRSLPREVLAAPPEALEATLVRLERSHRSVADLLATSGLTSTTRAALRHRLLDP